MTAPRSVLLTVDVEDWFQVENLRPAFPHESWSSCEWRVEKNVHRLLDLFDAVMLESSEAHSQVLVGHNGNGPDSNANAGIRATFFVLGWIAARFPHLIREIHQRGHEVASHGYNHRLCGECTHCELRRDIIDSKALLEDIIGAPVFGYRAPSFSVSEELLGLLKASGHVYDSSFNSFQLNRRHGKLGSRQSPTNGIASRHVSGMVELPISNLRLGPVSLPAGGGAYFRLIPLSVFESLVRLILQQHGAYVFYIHPWEIDPDQPRVGTIDMLSKFRHYTNLKSAQQKLHIFLEMLRDCRFMSCKGYLDQLPMLSRA